MTIKYRLSVNTLKEFKKFSLIFFKFQSISIHAIRSNRRQ